MNAKFREKRTSNMIRNNFLSKLKKGKDNHTIN